MIVTKEKTTIYKVAMTEAQANNLRILLETGKGSHVNELTVQAEWGTEVANNVRETCTDLLESLNENLED